MTSGQRMIVDLIRQHGGPVQRTVFMKLLFLLGHETPLAGPDFPYSFVPYQYGPFSFRAYRDLSRLLESSAISEGPNGLSPVPQPAAQTPSVRQAVAMSSIIERYGGVKRISLLRYTYTKYPWYTALSTMDDPVARRKQDLPLAEPAVYTVGYEGRDIDRFLDHLLHSGLRGVCDVRAVPASRSFGFHRKTLADHLDKLGLAYHAFPELGISTHERREYLGNGGDGLRALLGAYRRRLAEDGGEGVDRLAGLLKTATPLALMCMEHDARDCHRSILAKVLAEKTGLNIDHI